MTEEEQKTKGKELENCYMVGRGQAYELHIPKKTFFCEIPQGRCEYGNEGKRRIFTGSETGEVCICTSNGLVEKAAPEIKVQEKRSNPRKKRY